MNAVIMSDGKKAGDEGNGQKGAGFTKAVEERDMSLLMRVVDDFLYISPSSSHAKAFARTMGAGNPDYGAHINDKKSKVNFPVQVLLPLLCVRYRELPKISRKENDIFATGMSKWIKLPSSYVGRRW